MDFQLLTSSQVIRIAETTSLSYVLAADTPVRLGVVVDASNLGLNLEIYITATQPNSQCEIRIISILKHSTISVIANLKIEQGATNSILNLNHKTLLLDPMSSVKTEPRLQILQDQVKCGHGATISYLDSDQLEYLQTRGITRQNAESMLCSASINAVCEWALMKSDAEH